MMCTLLEAELSSLIPSFLLLKKGTIILVANTNNSYVRIRMYFKGMLKATSMCNQLELVVHLPCMHRLDG